MCDTIQRQQEALNLKPRATFNNLTKLTNEDIPILDKAWKLIDQFNVNFFSWWSTYFPSLNVEEMQEFNTEWNHKLNEIGKETKFMLHDNAVTFIDYITA